MKMNSNLGNAHLVAFLQGLLELRERTQARAIELVDPPLRNVIDRHEIDEVKFFAAPAFPRYEICLFENRQMLGNRLPRHVEPTAQIAQCLPIPFVQPVKELPAAGIRQGAEYGILAHAANM